MDKSHDTMGPWVCQNLNIFDIEVTSIINGKSSSICTVPRIKKGDFIQKTKTESST